MSERRIVYDNGRIGQIDPQISPRYAGFTTFARLPRADEVDQYDVAIVGVPFDSGVTYRPGSRFGPSSIRESSRMLKPYNPGQNTLPFQGRQVVDAGDIGCTPFDIEQANRQIRDGLRDVLAKGRHYIVLGGDHSIALPSLQAVTDVINRPVALIHFDSHLDTWDTYFGADFTHGSQFRRASEQGLLIKDHSVHVGIRGSIYSPEDFEDDERLGFTVIHASEFDRIGVDGILDRIRHRVEDTPVYVSIDIDVLDPSAAPGTGTPEIGGLTSRELLAVLRGLTGLNIIASDIVEVAPAYDHGDITSIAAANIAYELTTIMP